MAEEPPSVWPKDIYSADENSAASENPDDEAEAAPAQTVDLTNPDIDWSQLDTGGGRQRQGAGRSESQASPAGRPGVILVRRATPPMARPHCRSGNR